MIDADSAHAALVNVTDFSIVGAYTLRVEFSDGSEQIIDFEPILIGPLFGPLQDLNLFDQVELNHGVGTLIWPTGADVDPNVLHGWPAHVDAIVARRRRQFITAAPSGR